MNYSLSTPALNGEVVTQGHSDYCAANGHSTYKVAGVDQGMCPRCGERTAKATQPAPRTQVVSLYAGTVEHKTSYANQRGLAGRDLGISTLCAHGAPFMVGCTQCRQSGDVLVKIAR